MNAVERGGYALVQRAAGISECLRFDAYIQLASRRERERCAG